MSRNKKYKDKFPHSYRGDRAGQNRRYALNNAHKVQAHNKVRWAITIGKLKRLENCSICNDSGVIVAHHADYSKPLEVIWVCYKCHNDIHKPIY